MQSFLKLIGIIFLTAIGLAVLTNYETRTVGRHKRAESISRNAGYPVVAVGSGAEGVLALGQTARGVLVIAQGGAGLVTFAQGGVGLLFGLGQGMLGLLAICQGGLGLLFFFGQIGAGTFCAGQVVAGYAGAGQAAGVRRGRAYLEELSGEVGRTLSWRGR